MSGALSLAALFARLLALGGARALAALLGFLAMLELAPAAGPETLGRWSMLLAVQGWLLHVSEWGLRSVVTAEAGRTRGAGRQLLATYLGLRLLITSAVLTVALVTAALLDPQGLATTALVFSSLIAIALQLDWLALVEDRTLLAALLHLARPLSWWLLLHFCEPPLALERLAALFAASWAFAALASWSALIALVPRDPCARPWLSAPAMARRGFALMLTTLINQVVFSADLLLVGLWFGAQPAGAFFLAASCATAALVLANAMNQLALARAGALSEHREAQRSELLRQLLLATSCGVATASVCGLFAPFIPRLFGPEYAHAQAILLALLPWVVLQHPSAVLRGAVASEPRAFALLLRADCALALALALALVGALIVGSAVACGLARSFGELARLLVLLTSLRGGCFGTAARSDCRTPSSAQIAFGWSCGQPKRPPNEGVCSVAASKWQGPS